MTLDRRHFLMGSGLGALALAVGGARIHTRGPEPLAAAEEPGPRPISGPAPFEPADWDSVRAQFALAPDWIHMAGLLLSSHPAPVHAAIERHRRGLDDNPPHYLYGGPHGGEREVRDAAAAYMGARREDIALMGSTTMGLAMLYHGLELRAGQEVLTTTHDHRVTHESLEYATRRSGARVRQVPLYRQPHTAGVDEIVGSLVRNLGPETRAVAVTWVHSSTGVKLPIRAMADALAGVNARRDEADRVLLCVDGVHGFGVEDATMSDLGCDFFVAGTHKWLFGPRGTGVLWGHPRAQRLVSPTIPSFTFDGTWGGRMTPGGFHAFEHRWALANAFGFHQRIGKTRVAERIHALNRQAREGLAAMPHVTLHTPRSASLSSGIICFDARGHSPAQTVARLRERRIVASRTPYATSYARLTPGLLNTPDEVEATLAAIRALA
jgi:isopenicillin-N epimerase